MSRNSKESRHPGSYYKLENLGKYRVKNSSLSPPAGQAGANSRFFPESDRQSWASSALMFVFKLLLKQFVNVMHMSTGQVSSLFLRLREDMKKFVNCASCGSTVKGISA